MYLKDIPDTATHVWTPAIDTPKIGFCVSRRAFYKKIWGKWYSYTKDQYWLKSYNTPEWFKEERQLGYFVTIKKASSESFVPVKEVV